VVDRFRSKPLELPDPEHSFDRVDLVFYDVDHSGDSFEARIFIGAGRGLKRDAGVDHPAYAGSFYVFGHDRCYGEHGHCEVRDGRDPFDFRLPHHLEPTVRIVTVTEAVRRLLGAGKRKAAVDVIARGPQGKALDALDFSKLRLLTYA
jgi:hypothetical protein